MASDGGTSTWVTLKTAVAKYPALGVLVGLAVPLIGISAIFLAPFFIPLGIVSLLIMKAGPDAEVRRREHRVNARPRDLLSEAPRRKKNETRGRMRFDSAAVASSAFLKAAREIRHRTHAPARNDPLFPSSLPPPHVSIPSSLMSLLSPRAALRQGARLPHPQLQLRPHPSPSAQLQLPPLP